MTLRLLIDENVPTELTRRLRAMEGFVVESIFEDARGGTDVSILDRALGSGSVIVTADKDFGELVLARGRRSAGVVLLRCHPIAMHFDAIVAAIRAHSAELPGSFTVVTPSRVRVRSTPVPTGT